jgi:hypothetical protein
VSVRTFCVTDPPTFSGNENVLSTFEMSITLVVPVDVKLVVPVIGTAEALPAVNGNTNVATRAAALNIFRAESTIAPLINLAPSHMQFSSHSANILK